MRKEYNILVRMSERKRSLSRPKHRQEDNTEIDLREMGWKVVDWMRLAEDGDQWQTLVNKVMKLRIL
jgi:uncharacterized protein (DUF4415 family)